MRVFAIDDEPKMLRLLHVAIAQAAPEAEIIDFRLGAEAVSFLMDTGHDRAGTGCPAQEART